MPYLIFYTIDSHFSKIHSILKLFKTKNFNLFYYIISYYIFAILVLTFDIPFVYRISGTFESIVYSHFVYFFWVVFGIFLFYLFKLKVKVSTLFRASILSLVILSIYVMFFYSRLTTFSLILPIFAIRGAGVSLFALAFNVSYLDGLKDKQRDKFSLMLHSILTALPVFLPIIGGYIIDNLAIPSSPSNIYLPNGYFTLYLFGALLGVTLLIFSPAIKIYCDSTSGVVKPLSFLFNKKFDRIKNYQIYTIYSNATKGTVYGLLGFLILTNEFNLGLFSSIIALVGSLYFLFINKVEKKYHVHRIKFYIFGIVGEVISQIVLFLNLSLIGLLARSVATTLIIPLKNIFAENIVRKNYDTYSKELNISKSNFLLYHELLCFIGRFLSFVTLILFIKFVTTDVFLLFKYFIILFIILDTFEYFFIKKID